MNDPRLRLRKVNDEVFFVDEPIVRVGSAEIAFLKKQALANVRHRARICAHLSNEDALHEMLIALSRASYIRPHKHVGRAESFHIVEGEVDVAVFDECGTIIDVIELGVAGSKRNFFYRLSASVFHTLLIRTDYLIVHEVTAGPFDPSRTVLAPFAPPEERIEEAREYVRRVSEAAARFLRTVGPV